MRRVDALEAQVRAQAAPLRALSEQVGARQRRLLEAIRAPGGGSAAPPLGAAGVAAGRDEPRRSRRGRGSSATDHDTRPAPAPCGGVERPGRREILQRVGAAVAGGAVGGAVAALGSASPAMAASGVFDGSPAVSATSAGGTGVQASGYGAAVLAEATASFGTGVQGRGQGIGVRGVNAGSSGVGVEGMSDFGVALRALLNDVGRAHLQLASYEPIQPPYLQSGMHDAGELLLDRDRVLWLCVTSGGPGVWRRVGGPNTTGSLTMLTAPVRAYDSRPGNPPSTGPKARLGDGWSREIDVSVSGTVVPVTATAVLVNVTVVNTSATGFLTAFAHGVAVPAASTINWNLPSSIVANTTIVRVAGGRLDCYVPPGSSTDFFLDVVGYFL